MVPAHIVCNKLGSQEFAEKCFQLYDLYDAPCVEIGGVESDCGWIPAPYYFYMDGAAVDHAFLFAARGAVTL